MARADTRIAANASTPSLPPVLALSLPADAPDDDTGAAIVVTVCGRKGRAVLLKVLGPEPGRKGRHPLAHVVQLQWREACAGLGRNVLGPEEHRQQGPALPRRAAVPVLRALRGLPAVTHIGLCHPQQLLGRRARLAHCVIRESGDRGCLYARSLAEPSPYAARTHLRGLSVRMAPPRFSP